MSNKSQEKAVVRTYPINASTGKDNAFYHYCNVVQHNTPYASCLNKLRLQKDGALPDLYSACGAGIETGKCGAEGMREQELGAGVSMFYIDRAELRAEWDAREEAAEQAMASDAEKHAGKVSKRPVRQVTETDISEAMTVQESVRSVVKSQQVAKEVALDFSAAIAQAISDEAVKLNQPTVVVAVKPIEQPSVMQAGKKTMLEIAREMAASRKSATSA